MSQLFGDAFEARIAARDPGVFAIREGEAGLDFATLDDRAQKLGRLLLTLGHKPGDGIGALHSRALPMVTLFLACQHAGLAFIPLNLMLTGGEIARIARITGFRRMLIKAGREAQLVGEGFDLTEAVLVSDVGFDRWIAEQLEAVGLTPTSGLVALPDKIDPRSAVLVISSSGSMGNPKCVEISRAGYQRQIMAQSEAGEIRSDDIAQLVLPLFHAAGLIGVIGICFARGAQVRALLGPFRGPAVLAHIREESITVTHWIPTMIARCCDYMDAAENDELAVVPASFRAIHFGSMRLSDQVREAAIRLFPGRLMQSYGSTECGFVACLPTADLEAGSTRTGRLVAGSGPRIIDDSGQDVPVGETGEMAMPVELAAISRYIGDPALTDRTIRNGFVYSGDEVRNDGDGYFTILGRLDSVIVTGGLKVYPSETEARILEATQLSEVAVIGVPDREFGELVCAVLPESAGKLTLEDLRDLCRPLLAGYKLPRRLEIVGALPRTNTGKVAYGRLRDQFSGATPAVPDGS